MIKSPVLSLLIPTVPRHLGFFNTLWEIISLQVANRNDVEVVGLFDNRFKSIGEKRNILLENASGRWFAFIDSDDWIAEDFVDIVVKSLLSKKPDLLVYQTIVVTPSKPDYLCDYDVSCSKEERRFEGDPWTHYYGPPAHHHVWRTDLVRGIKFPEVNVGEDFAWTSQARLIVKSQFKIDRPLYWYRYDIATSESSKKK